LQWNHYQADLIWPLMLPFQAGTDQCLVYPSRFQVQQVHHEKGMMEIKRKIVFVRKLAAASYEQ
jgi:hypothetical protein